MANGTLKSHDGHWPSFDQHFIILKQVDLLPLFEQMMTFENTSNVKKLPLPGRERETVIFRLLL